MLTTFLLATLAAAPAVTVTDGWVREAPPNAAVLAGYMVLTNSGKKKAVTLRGASSPRFRLVEMHTTIKTGEMVRMEPIKQFKLVPGQALTFKPGGNHLMLIDPKQAVKVGDRLPVTLDFGADGKAEVILVVKARN